MSGPLLLVFWVGLALIGALSAGAFIQGLRGV